jgi:hypothetical protein
VDRGAAKGDQCEQGWRWEEVTAEIGASARRALVLHYCCLHITYGKVFRLAGYFWPLVNLANGMQEHRRYSTEQEARAWVEERVHEQYPQLFEPPKPRGFNAQVRLPVRLRAPRRR